MLGDNDPRDFIGRKRTPICLPLAISITLFDNVSGLERLRGSEMKTYFASIVKPIAIDVHVSNEHKGSTLFS